VLIAYRQALAGGALKADCAQEAAAAKLAALAAALGGPRPLFRRHRPLKGLYIWGDVGRGKTLLMDFFFAEAPVEKKRRAHFNSFMLDVHARIHALRQEGADDPIKPAAREIAAEARLLCFDEFQVTDIADAMILGRLFDRLFAQGVIIVATSNTPPDRLYEGGLNRQLFLPFIAEIKRRMEIIALNGPTDYRLARMAGLKVYMSPLGAGSDAAMDAAWQRLTDTPRGKPAALTVLGRHVAVPQAARGVARFSFADLCEKPLGAADYLAIARDFHTLLIDHIPLLDDSARNAARRFTLLIDTLYDEGVKLVCSAAAAPEALYPDAPESFRRTVSRLAEMGSADYLARGHGIHRLPPPSGEALEEGDAAARCLRGANPGCGRGG
jgi:cell division protein ZapE